MTSDSDALAVERARRLVHEQRLGGEREGARDGGALLLAARELVRAGVGARRDADALEQRARLAGRRRRARGRATWMGASMTFSSTVRCGKEVPLLEDEADAPTHAREGAA